MFCYWFCCFCWFQVHLNCLVLLLLVILPLRLANAKRSLWRWWNIFAERLSGCSLSTQPGSVGWLRMHHEVWSISMGLRVWSRESWTIWRKWWMGLRFQKYPFLSSFEGSFRLPHAMVARTNPDVTYAYIRIKRIRSAIWMHLKGRCSY